MNEFLLFALTVALGCWAWGDVCLRYVWPRLRSRPLATAAGPLLTVHLFRYLGLSFLFVGVTGPTLPGAFTHVAADGDLIAAALAWLALLLLGRPIGVAALWVFNVWGTFDLFLAFAKALTNPNFHPSALGATFYVPTFYVPLLVWTHGLLFVLLLRPSVLPTNPTPASQAHNHPAVP